MVFYNENDPRTVAWLKQLVADGHLEQGVVDGRSITEIKGPDCAETSHFFAGVGGWPLGLELAGWPPGIPVWTGSCPCQPFSKAGKQRGFEDERHLWPVWRQLIAECSPPVIFGEQAGEDSARVWLSVVRADLEAMGYAVGAADLCAAGIGSPSKRQRIYFGAVRLADAECISSQRLGYDLDGTAQEARQQRIRTESQPGGIDDGLADADSERGQGWYTNYRSEEQWEAWARRVDYIYCSDGYHRPVEAGTRPLAHGVPERVVRLRGYGNAVVPQLVEKFVRGFMEAVCSVQI